MGRRSKHWGGLQSNLKPFQASEVREKCLNQQGIPKNVMLGTKNIKIGPLGPELAHTKVTAGLHMGISRNWLLLVNKASNRNSETTLYSSTFRCTY